MPPAVLNIRDIIKKRQVSTFFQPLVSIKKRSLLGFEALSRGHMADRELIIPPNVLFSLARQDGLSLDLDRLCRSKSLETFAPLHQKEKGLMISINMDTSLLDTGEAVSGYLAKQAAACCVNPNNVIIELIESDVQDGDRLLEFIDQYRKLGFLIALDDVGSGHSNLERIALIKPEVIKIDRSLITDIDKEFHKAEITKSLVSLGNKIGAMVLAEGVEREEEVFCLLELGVDVFQGFYFRRPFVYTGQEWDFLERVEYIADGFSVRVLERINARKQQVKAYDAVLGMILNALTGSKPREFERRLVEAIAANQMLECLYVIDTSGIQFTSTVCNPYRINENKRFIYQPAQRGADHSLKDYFLPIKAGLPRYITEEYISLASGNMCTTLSATFHCTTGERFVLCMDIGEGGEEEAEGTVVCDCAYTA